MRMSYDQPTNKTMLHDSYELYGYTFKQAFKAYLTKESKETMNLTEYFTGKRSIEKMDIKL
jgi:hypothetical protein